MMTPSEGTSFVSRISRLPLYSYYEIEMEALLNGTGKAPLTEQTEIVEHIFHDPRFQNRPANDQISLLSFIFNDEKYKSFDWGKALLVSVPFYQNRSPIAVFIDDMNEKTSHVVSFMVAGILSSEYSDFRFPNAGQGFLSSPTELLQKFKIIHKTIADMKKSAIRVPYLQDTINAFNAGQATYFWKNAWLGDGVVEKMITSEGDKTFIDIPADPQMQKATPKTSKNQYSVPPANLVEDLFASSLSIEYVSKAGEVVSAATAQTAMDKLVGLKDQKKVIQNFINGRRAVELAQHAGISPPVNDFSNFIISGPSGVGKTSLAKAVALKLKAEQIVDTNARIGLVSASTLTGLHIGDSQDNIKRCLEILKGGVLILDEIDALTRVPKFGENALDTLNALIGNMCNPPILIVTTYEKTIADLYSANEGLRRRFPNVVKIGDYKENDLMRIWNASVREACMECTWEAREQVANTIRQMKKSPNFGNAGTVKTILEKAWENIVARFQESTEAGKDDTNLAQIKKQLGIITLDDIPEFRKGMLVRPPKKPDTATISGNNVLSFGKNSSLE